MNNIDKQYLSLCQDILDNGTKKQTRTGTDAISIFGRHIRHKMSDGFPLLTTKKMAWKQIVTELLWFLRGDTSVEFLHDNDCHIWDGDLYYNFLRNIESYVESISDNEVVIPNKEEFINKIKTDDEFAKKWGELGPIYPKQWRKWHTGWDVVEDKNTESGVRRIECGIDQIANLIRDIKTKPDSRDLKVSAWNVGELDQMVLKPCHTDFQVYTRELSHKERFVYYTRNSNTGLTEINFTPLQLDELNVPKRAISLMWNQRSVDVPLGLPFNIASYGLLLEMLAKQVNMVPEELIGNLGDCHIYENQIDGIKEQLTRESFALPVLEINNEFWNHEYQTIDGYINSMEVGDFQVENYQSHPAIKIPLSN